MVLCFYQTINPADVGTRGITADQFLSNNVWIRSPPELKNSFDSFVNVFFETCNDVPDIRKEKFVSFVTILDNSILSRYSRTINC